MIYFDNAATTKVNPQILTLYSKILEDYYGNQGSSHAFGLRVNELVEKSRKSILRQFHLANDDYQLVFTSGATEANNLFLKGGALNYQNRGKKIITSAGEHPSVIRPLERLAQQFGFKIILIPLNQDGSVNIENLISAIDAETIIVSVMAVNNETGAINDLEKIARSLKKFPKCLFHSDITQALAKVEINYQLLDAFSFSAHKINGLKGSGALIFKRSIQLIPQIEGGSYEGGFRHGTPDSPKNIVLAKTIKLALNNFHERLESINQLNQEFRNYLATCDNLSINSSQNSVPHIINFSLEKHRAAVIAAGLSKHDIMVGTTSACSSKKHQPSKVVLAMFNDEYRASNVIRVSFGYYNTLREVQEFIKVLAKLMTETKYE